MDNLASFVALIPGTAPNSVVPCIKILRGIDIASRQQSAKFTLRITMSYPSGGVIVTTPPFASLVSATSFHQQVDPMWVDVHTSQITLSPAPDPSSNATCNAHLTIDDVNRTTVDCSLVDSQVISLPSSAGNSF